MKAIQLHVNSTKTLAFVVSQHIKRTRKKNSPQDVIVREREALSGETNHGQTKKQLSKEEQTCSMRKK
jgi:cAMP phosphodiesterase